MAKTKRQRQTCDGVRLVVSVGETKRPRLTRDNEPTTYNYEAYERRRGRREREQEDEVVKQT